MKGFLAIKQGMTMSFDKNGNVVPITIVSYNKNYVTKKHTFEKDGYTSLQLSILDKKKSRSNKSEIQRFKKAKTTPKYYSREIRDFSGYDVGDFLDIKELFKVGEYVDVTSFSKGKGFSGAIKRHNYSRGPMAHGSGYHRGAGSMGAITQNRVFKGKKLPGRMGNEKVTIQNLAILDIDESLNVILIRGSIPGSKNSLVIIKESIKKSNEVIEFEKFNYKKSSETLEKIQEAVKKEHEIDDIKKKEEEKEKLKAERAAVENKERI